MSDILFSNPTISIRVVYDDKVRYKWATPNRDTIFRAVAVKTRRDRVRNEDIREAVGRRTF